MLKDLFRNRLFIGALAIFIFCVGGSLLYMQHETQKGEKELAETQERVAQWNEKQKQPTAETPVVEQPEQVGHFHSDGTWHEGPHTGAPEAIAPSTAELQKSASGREPQQGGHFHDDGTFHAQPHETVNISSPLDDATLTADWNEDLLPFNATADEIVREQHKLNILIEEHEAERELLKAEHHEHMKVIESGNNLTDEFAGLILENRKRTKEFLRKSDILSKRLARVREVDAQQRRN